MKERIIAVGLAVCAVAWGVRYYAVNHTFLPHYECETEIKAMNETVYFSNNMSYNVYYSPGYSITVDHVKLIDADSFLETYQKTAEDFDILPEKFLEVETTIENIDSTNTEEGIYFYQLPVVGIDWYTFFNGTATAYANDFFQDDTAASYGVLVHEGEKATVKILYDIKEDFFTTERWNNIEQEEMWMSVTINPLQQKIKLAF